MKIAPAILAALVGAAFSGCGTLVTRTSAPVVGAWPFEGAACDVALVAHAFTAESQADRETNFLIGLLSLPIDLVIDAALAPVDLIAWLFGAHKTPMKLP
ncbi:MAG: hypothetical protein WAT39_07780 [Planctomycetota bacterium]